tara:strand:+ start:594 stop:1238 length:645 start_codon:yes stop_codon:yes gene_type:complete
MKMNEMLAKNPGYNHTIYNDDEIDTFVNTHYPGRIASAYNKLNIIVAKVDFWRYLVLYKYGGIYLDMDSSINCSLDSFINDDDEAIITAEGNPDKYVQWALIFNKNHPILKNTIDFIVDNIECNKFPNDILHMTGPVVYTRGVNSIHNKLFGCDLDHSKYKKGGEDTFQKDNIKYRIYRKDYGKYFTFKYKESDLLYVEKKPWRQELKSKKLLI